LDAKFANGKEQAQAQPKSVLKLPDLEQSTSAVLNSLTSQSSQRSYDHAIREFTDWYCSEPRLAFKDAAAMSLSPAFRHYVHLAALRSSRPLTASPGDVTAGSVKMRS
jgi:hypothetical protein